MEMVGGGIQLEMVGGGIQMEMVGGVYVIECRPGYTFWSHIIVPDRENRNTIRNNYMGPYHIWSGVPGYAGPPPVMVWVPGYAAWPPPVMVWVTCHRPRPPSGIGDYSRHWGPSSYLAMPPWGFPRDS